MARLVRLDALRNAIRRRADVRSEVRWTNPILTDLINEAIPEWQDLILRHNQDWLLRSQLFNIAQDVQEYDITAMGAADFYKGRGVDILDSNSRWETLLPYNWGERNDNPTSTTSRQSLRYALQEDSLWFDRPPGWSEANGAHLWYWPVLAALVADADTIDDHNGWSKWLMLRVAIEVVGADRRDITALAAQLGKAEASIAGAAVTRDVGECKTVRNVRTFLGGKRFDPLPRP